jgi:hypothetical protein
MTMHWKMRQASLYDLQNVLSTRVLAGTPGLFADAMLS